MAKAQSKKTETTVQVRLTNDELANLDSFVELMSEQRPGTRVTRSDVLRAMLAKGEW